jgi:hypothetical protein
VQDIFVDGEQTATIDAVRCDTVVSGSRNSKSKGRGRKRAMLPSNALPAGCLARSPVPSICIPPIAYLTHMHILHPGHGGEVARGKVGAS